MAKRKKKCDPRKPWPYPANNVDLETPHWANFCPCGWYSNGHKSEDEAKQALADHIKEKT